MRLAPQIASVPPSSTDVFLTTQIVPTALLVRGDILAIAEQVRLESGDRFIVDSHGIWFTTSEIQSMDAGVSFDQIVWTTGKRPNMPSR
jgi:hypothetical protein